MQDPVPGAVTGVAGVTLPHCLPRPELLARQIPPRNACSVAVDDALDYPAVIAKRMPLPPFVRGQQGLDPLPLLICELAKP